MCFVWKIFGLMGDKSYYGAVYQVGPNSSDCCNNDTSALILQLPLQ